MITYEVEYGWEGEEHRVETVEVADDGRTPEEAVSDCLQGYGIIPDYISSIKKI